MSDKDTILIGIKNSAALFHFSCFDNLRLTLSHLILKNKMVNFAFD